MAKFGIIGAAGFIAKRHMEAIAHCGGELVAVCDTNDSVGVVDNYNFKATYLRYEAEFLEFCSKNGVDYVVVCTPNYGHYAQTTKALSYDLNVICEKPLCIAMDQYESIKVAESYSKGTVYPVLQLRTKPQVHSMMAHIHDTNPKTASALYTVRRGQWYDESWKGYYHKSGGPLFNIGIHLFDILIYMFGSPGEQAVEIFAPRHVEGVGRFGDCTINWTVQICDRTTRKVSAGGKTIDIHTIDQSLHNAVYRNILEGNWVGIDEAREAIECIERINQSYYGTPDDWRRSRSDAAVSESKRLR